MADTFSIKRGDRLPPLRATLRDATGAAVNLSSGVSAVIFNMRHKTTRIVKVNRGVATAVDAAAGVYEYQWGATDTDTAGDYLGEFEVVLASGGVTTYPNAGDIAIKIGVDHG